MNFLIILLTFVLVLACLFLILLVLVQLPKKEAGLGQAFGSGATDALFGPGSGNMLTKLTKWTAAIFFVLTLLIWVMQGHSAKARGVDPRSKLSITDKAGVGAPAAAKTDTTPDKTNVIAPPANAPAPANPAPNTPPAPAPATPPVPAPAPK